MGLKTDMEIDLEEAVADPDGLADVYFTGLIYTMPDGQTTHTTSAIIPEIAVEETDGESVQTATIEPIILKKWLAVDVEVDGILRFKGNDYIVGKPELTADVVWNFVAKG